MNRERHIYIGIIITLVMALAITILLFSQFGNETWREVAKSFIFPFIYTLICSIIVALVGTTIADKVLKNYTERVSYGLSGRVIQLIGDTELSKRIAQDLKKSALVRNQIIPDKEKVAAEADLVILSLDLPHEISKRNTDQERAEEKLGTVLEQLKQNNDTQGLIVLTPGQLKRGNEHTEEFFKRAFSTIVNAQGRVLSDIHSLLTTLPPRNGE
jgi:hypothetical protein